MTQAAAARLSAEQDLHSRPDPIEPFFLVGAVRSGTTVLRLLLGHHPQICRCEEFEYVTPAIAGKHGWPDVDSYRRELPHLRDFRATGYRADPKLDFPSLARDFLKQLQAEDGRRIVGATVHNHFEELPRIWPTARYIYLERDPRDVARSCVQMGWAGNAWCGAAIWQNAHDAWQTLRASLPANRFIEVRFEDLVANAEAQLSRITSFLGLDFDPAMLELEKDTTYKRPSPAGSRSWRTDAPEREVREVETRLGSRLSEAGYPPSGLPALQVGTLRRLALQIENKLGRMKFKQRRYGWPLWAAFEVSRRLPFDAPRHRWQLAIDRVDEQHLK